MRYDDNDDDIDNENMITNNISKNSNIMVKNSINAVTSNSNSINSSSSTIPSSPIPSPINASTITSPRSIFDRRNASIVNKKYNELRGTDDNDGDIIIYDDINNDSNSDINDEEDGDIIIQRRNYKNRATVIHDKNKPLPSPLWSKGNNDEADDDDAFVTYSHKNHNQNHFFNKSEKNKVQEKVTK